MRYELRRWIDSDMQEYVVRQTSDDFNAIMDQYKRAFTASSEPNLLFIHDTYVTDKIFDCEAAK